MTASLLPSSRMNRLPRQWRRVIRTPPKSRCARAYEDDGKASGQSPVNNLSDYGTDWGVIMATGMLHAILQIIFTFAASKQIIAGMTAGAVKG